MKINLMSPTDAVRYSVYLPLIDRVIACEPPKQLRTEQIEDLAPIAG